MKKERQPRTAKIHPKTQKLLSEKVKNYVLQLGATTTERKEGYAALHNPLGCGFETLNKFRQNVAIQSNKLEGIFKWFDVKFEIVGGVYKHVENGEK